MVDDDIIQRKALLRKLISELEERLLEADDDRTYGKIMNELYTYYDELTSYD